MQKIKAFLLSQRFQELLRYGVIGLATTVVNYAIYVIVAHPLGTLLTGQPVAHPLDTLLTGQPEPDPLWVTLSDAIAWVGAVLFAYPLNCRWVFRAKSDRVGFFSFVKSRLLSLGVDLVLINLLMSVGISDSIAKIIANVVVIIMNYITGRLIFARTPKRH